MGIFQTAGSSKKYVLGLLWVRQFVKFRCWYVLQNISQTTHGLDRGFFEKLENIHLEIVIGIELVEYLVRVGLQLFLRLEPSNQQMMYLLRLQKTMNGYMVAN